MLEKDCLIYPGPEKFPTRRSELMQKKPSKEISIDRSQLIIKDKQSDLTCPTVTELEVCNALKRRALAFDLVGVCVNVFMASYHADLLHHLHTPPPPPGYSAVSVQQILRADRAAFLFMSERMTSTKRNAINQLPMDLALPAILSQPTVAFHLLPLSGATQKAASPNKTANPKKRSRSHRQPKGKGKGGPKGCAAALINKALETQKQGLQFFYPMVCAKGIHLCGEPRCFKPHSLQDHR